jgi:hypothetical protein
VNFLDSSGTQQTSTDNPSGEVSHYFPGNSQQTLFLKWRFQSPGLKHPALKEAGLCSCFSAGNRNVPGRIRNVPESSVKGWELCKLESGQNIWKFKDRNVKLVIRLHKFSEK